jgi:hypothetical protein
VQATTSGSGNISDLNFGKFWNQTSFDAADISAVSQLVLRERLSRDLGLWEQMRDCVGLIALATVQAIPRLAAPSGASNAPSDH